ncbi:hypothetical protein V1512DRAFT_268710 [Lipomyces arxii]|uniref:uncharacterized protein n=1 Tax=Lipomyces arxii TaxID=56418 RepID=UPI0034CEA5E2
MPAGLPSLNLDSNIRLHTKLIEKSVNSQNKAGDYSGLSVKHERESMTVSLRTIDGKENTAKFTPDRILRSNGKSKDSYVEVGEADSSLLEIGQTKERSLLEDLENVEWPSSHYSDHDPANTPYDTHNQQVHNDATMLQSNELDDLEETKRFQRRKEYVKPFEKPQRYPMRQDRAANKRSASKPDCKSVSHKDCENNRPASTKKRKKTKTKSLVDMLTKLDGSSSARLTLPSKTKSGIFSHFKQSSERKSAGGSIDLHMRANNDQNHLETNFLLEVPDLTFSNIDNLTQHLPSLQSQHSDRQDGAEAVLPTCDERYPIKPNDKTEDVIAPQPARAPITSVLQLLNEHEPNIIYNVGNNCTDLGSNSTASVSSLAETTDLIASCTKLAREVQDLADAISSGQVVGDGPTISGVNQDNTNSTNTSTYWPTDDIVMSNNTNEYSNKYISMHNDDAYSEKESLLEFHSIDGDQQRRIRLDCASIPFPEYDGRDDLSGPFKLPFSFEEYNTVSYSDANNLRDRDTTYLADDTSSCGGVGESMIPENITNGPDCCKDTDISEFFSFQSDAMGSEYDAKSVSGMGLSDNLMIHDPHNALNQLNVDWTKLPDLQALYCENEIRPPKFRFNSLY